MYIGNPQVTIRPGESLRLQCQAQGAGQFTIEWTKDGGMLTVDMSSHTFYHHGCFTYTVLVFIIDVVL